MRPLVLRPLRFELAQRDRPAALRDHQAAHAAQLSEDLIAGLGQFGAVFLSGTLAVEPDLLLGRGDGQVRVVSVPLIYARLRDHRSAERVVAVRVQRADPVRSDRQVAARQFRGRRARVTRHQHRIRTVLFHRTPDLAGDVRRLAAPWSAEDAVLPCNPVIALPDLLKRPGGLFLRWHHWCAPPSYPASIQRDRTGPMAAPTGPAL